MTFLEFATSYQSCMESLNDPSVKKLMGSFRLHGLPIWLLRNPQPMTQRFVISAAESVIHTCILICPDAERAMLERLADQRLTVVI